MPESPIVDGIKVRWEPPDLLVLTYHGHVTAAHVEKAVAEARQYTAACPYHLALLDVHALSTMTHDARKVAVRSSEGVVIRGVAVVGASFHVRVLGGLMNRAAQLVLSAKDNPLEFFATEAEARVWLAQRHQAIAKERPAGS